MLWIKLETGAKMVSEEITNISLADKVASLSAKLDLYDGVFFSHKSVVIM